MRLVTVMLCIGVALQDSAVLFQLVFIKGDYLVGRGIALIFERDNFQSECGGRDVNVSALFVVIRIGFRVRFSAGINRKPGVTHIGIFVYVDSAEWSFDVNLFVFVFVIAAFFYVDAACRKHEEGGDESEQGREMGAISHNSSNARGFTCGPTSLPTR